MSIDTLERLTKSVLNIPGAEEITFLWHGGEPLLMGVDFYSEAVSLQKKYRDGKAIKNSIQTNSILIDEEFLDFFQSNEFTIGSSLDGPEQYHDINRIHKDGRGTFMDVWEGLKKIWARNKDIRKENERGHLGGGVICILNRSNINYAEEIYGFFKANNLSFKINPLIHSGAAVDKLHELGIGHLEYGSALIRIFNKWFYEPEFGIDVDPLSEIIGNLLTGQVSSCSFSENCGDSFLSVGPNGDVYPCGRFDGVRDFRLGNICNDSLQDILNRRSCAEFRRSKPPDKTCRTCGFIKICNSGCMHNSYMTNGSIVGKDYYCASYKLLFKHIKSAVTSELLKASNQP